MSSPSATLDRSGNDAQPGATDDPVLPLEHRYASLPDVFHARVAPTPVRAPRLLRVNRALAEALRLDPDALASADGVATLAGNRVPDGAVPVAMAYAGHQFGGFVPSLGDGRAVLLGERVDRDGRCREIQLKGSGRTPFSRGGDGRAPLGPVLREYVVSEAMAGLGIPTTRTLAMVETGEPVYRERALPGAVLTRVATSHVRVGTFEYLRSRDDTDALGILAAHVIERSHPHCADAEHPVRALLHSVVRRQAELIARWLQVGFIHGVMNTDNTSIAGETIDYGPCAFLDHYQPDMVFSSIDRGGRYAYDQQPAIGLWNLTRLAQCLLPLLGDTEDDAVNAARDALNAYAPAFEQAHHAGLLAKIGIRDTREDDLELVRDLLALMAAQRADFTNTFRALCDAEAASGTSAARDGFAQDPAAFDAWAARWRRRLADEPGDIDARRDGMRAVNPAYIARNHRIEQAIEAVENDAADSGLLDDLLTVVSRPFDDHPSLAYLARAPESHEVVRQTFCGT